MVTGIGSKVALVAVLLSGAVCFAQSSSEVIYKAKCQMCHGVKGMADTPAAKAMKVKPITDPDVKGFTDAKMIEAVRNGTGKMQPYKDKLTNAQITGVVAYFRTFLK
ncbi:MAG: cytochrome c [Acidobacteriota bacterium]|nr:cytochrome c [Acidobacteriota bacterium]